MRWLLMILVAGVALSGCASSCDATATMAGVHAAQAMPALGPGHVDGYTVTCTDSTVFLDGGPDPETDGGFLDGGIVEAGVISSSTGTQVAYSCRVPADAGMVWVGDRDVMSDGSGGGEYALAGERFGGHLKREYCRAASGTQVVYCRAMVTSAP